MAIYVNYLLPDDFHFSQGEGSLNSKKIIASVIFAAGKGSRMKDYEGNKTLLPLIPEKGPFKGEKPILLRILNTLPPGPMAIVVNHKKEDVIETTGHLNLTYCEQPELNGTGGAILAALDFIKNTEYDFLLVTMGDTPLVRESTFSKLIDVLESGHIAVLGFRPADRKKYGVLDIEDSKVKRIIEWEYWKDYPESEQERLSVCNAGIYAVRKNEILRYLDLLSRKPHTVLKERNGRQVEIKEYFITDMIQWMYEDGLKTGCCVADNEYEVMGVDDVDSLKLAQKIFREEH